MDPSLHRSIAERTASQLGHITRPQLLALGARYDQIARLVDLSFLTQVGERTYRLAGLPPAWDVGAMAACLDLGGVCSHRTAARLHGLKGFEGFEPIEVMILKGRRMGSSPLAIVRRTTSLPQSDVTAVGGVPATSVARTILGLAALPDHVTDERLRDVVDDAVLRGLASDRWLWWLLDLRRCRGRDGVARMEEVLAVRARLGPTESWLEREFLDCIERGGLPLPIVQRRIRRRGAFVARVDFLYDIDRLVIEVKGHATHRTREELTRDAERENALQAMGFRVLQFTYDHLMHDVGYVRATVSDALERDGRAAA